MIMSSTPRCRSPSCTSHLTLSRAQTPAARTVTPTAPTAPLLQRPAPCQPQTYSQPQTCSHVPGLPLPAHRLLSGSSHTPSTATLEPCSNHHNHQTNRLSNHINHLYKQRSQSTGQRRVALVVGLVWWLWRANEVVAVVMMQWQGRKGRLRAGAVVGVEVGTGAVR